jgi:hypothetical protein
MSRTIAAKNWQPSALDQKLIIEWRTISSSQKSALWSSVHDDSYTQRLWLEVQAVFMGDPVKYPSVMAAQNDFKGRKDFLEKCEAICPPSEVPRGPKSERLNHLSTVLAYVLMYISAIASLQCQASQELRSHPYSGEIITGLISRCKCS